MCVCVLASCCTLSGIIHVIVTARCAVSALASWRADREGWCTTTDSFLATLEERTRSLARRADFHQKALDEVVETQEGMAASLQAARKAGEGAAATALAPVRVRCRNPKTETCTVVCSTTAYDKSREYDGRSKAAVDAFRGAIRARCKRDVCADDTNICTMYAVLPRGT